MELYIVLKINGLEEILGTPAEKIEADSNAVRVVLNFDQLSTLFEQIEQMLNDYRLLGMK